MVVNEVSVSVKTKNVRLLNPGKGILNYHLVTLPTVSDFSYASKVTPSKHQISETHASLFEAVRMNRSLPHCSYGKNIAKHETNDFVFSF